MIKLQKFKTKKKNNKEFLQLKLSSKDRVNINEVQILSNAEDGGLLGLICEKSNKLKVIKYDISHKLTLKEYLSNPQTRDSFIQVLQGIIKTLRYCEENQLNPKKIIYDTSYTFVDAVSKAVLFVYCPIENFENEGSIEHFVASVASETVTSQSQDGSFIIEFRKFVENMKFFSLIDFEKKVNSFCEEKKDDGFSERKSGRYSGKMVYDPLAYLEREEGFFNPVSNDKCRCSNCNLEYPEGTKFCKECGANLTPIKGYTEPEEKQPLKKKRQTKLVKRASSEEWGSLLRVSNNTEFVINKDTIIIGYDDDCDLVINDNETISGHHAEISIVEDVVYITDSQSTNGTFLNDKELPLLKKCKLNDGDKIEFADEVFVFRGKITDE